MTDEELIAKTKNSCACRSPDRCGLSVVDYKSCIGCLARHCVDRLESALASNLQLSEDRQKLFDLADQRRLLLQEIHVAIWPTSDDVFPVVQDGVPWCDESCPSHDGKRCRILGHRPDRICEPAVIALTGEIAAERARAEKAEAELTEIDAILAVPAPGPWMPLETRAHNLRTNYDALLAERDALREALAAWELECSDGQKTAVSEE